MMRSARSRAWKAAIAVAALAVIGAACAPIAPSPPPPPPPPPTTSPPPPPPPAGCNEEPATPGAVEYFATVDDGDAVDEAVPFEASSQAEYEQKVDEIEAVEGPVIAVEVDQPVSALAIDDPRAGEQWGITAASFEQAWTEAGSQGASVTVAVLDTGSQAAHEDLTGGVIQGADYAEGTPPQGTSDYGRVDLHGGGCASGSH
jgi:subtilisin family serine protease